MDQDLSISDFMSHVPDYFVPEKAQGVDAVTQFHLTGEGGGDWIVTIRDQKCTVNQGLAQDPKMSLTADTKDLQSIWAGKLDPMRAFMQGKIRFKGDMGLAMKLANMFKMPSR